MRDVRFSNEQTTASDGDSLTQRQQLLSPCHPDATNVLDGMVNKRFELALKKVNRKCDPSLADLEQALLSQVGDKKILGINTTLGVLEGPIDRGLTKEYRVDGKRVRIPSLAIDRSKSIYRDAKLLESPAVVIKFIGMASHFKVDNLIVGSDKLTHFFAQGHEYIEVQRTEGLQAAVQHGVSTEEGKYGLKGNGIYSYGDLSANYSGFLFWNNLTHPTEGHFAKCNGKWVQIRQFSWRCYIIQRGTKPSIHHMVLPSTKLSVTSMPSFAATRFRIACHCTERKSLPLQTPIRNGYYRMF